MEYNCMDCNFRTSNKQLMKEHTTVQHKPNKPEEVKFACTDCLNEFIKEEDYNEHVKKHGVVDVQDQGLEEVPVEDTQAGDEMQDYDDLNDPLFHDLCNVVYNYILEGVIECEVGSTCVICGNKSSDDYQLREAFHSKKQRNLGISPKW